MDVDLKYLIETEAVRNQAALIIGRLDGQSLPYAALRDAVPGKYFLPALDILVDRGIIGVGGAEELPRVSYDDSFRPDDQLYLI